MAEEDEKIVIQEKDIIKELGLESLSVERQEKLIQEISDAVYDRILFKIADKLTEEEAIELNNLLDRGEKKKIYKYVKEKIPDLASLLKEEIRKFEDKIIEETKKEFLKKKTT